MSDPAPKRFEEIDKTLESISKKLRVIHYIEPANSLEQKKEFLKGKTKNPKFSYIEPDYNAREVAKLLENIKIPECDSSTHYERKIRKLLIKNRIVESRGSREVKNLSLSLFPEPSKKLVAKAEKLLYNLEDIEENKLLHSVEVVKKLKKSLEKLDGWRVDYHDKHGAFVNNAIKTLFINKYRRFNENDTKRLINHEIKVHIYRYENSRNQPQGVLREMCEDYLITEEGLAVYAEEVTGTLNNRVLREYAGRVIAVDSVIKGEAFCQTFERLQSFGINEEQTWQLTLRVHRGGGFVKDHVYLQGYYEIKNYIENGGDLRTLYIGKISLHFAEKAERLMKSGIINSPKYFPDFFKTSSKFASL